MLIKSRYLRSAASQLFSVTLPSLARVKAVTSTAVDFSIPVLLVFSHTSVLHASDFTFSLVRSLLTWDQSPLSRVRVVSRIVAVEWSLVRRGWYKTTYLKTRTTPNSVVK